VPEVSAKAAASYPSVGEVGYGLGALVVIKLCDLRWHKRRTPCAVLVGKVGDFWLMLVPRSGRDISKEDAAHDVAYTTLFISAEKPFNGPDLPSDK
jgi:hypothetical protein